VLLLGVQALRRAPLVPVRGERLAVFLLGAVGYATESTFFFLGLERGTAAAVGLIFYSYPAMVAGAELVVGSTRPSASLFGAVVLSIVGTAVVIATGEDVSITTGGVVFSLLAAATFTVYFLSGHRLARRTDAVVNAAWVSLGASLSILARGALTGSLDVPGTRVTQLVTYGIANAFAFGCMFGALRRLGPTRTAVILTFEVVATVVLAALFLDETLRALQLVGGAAIAVGAVLVARSGVEAAAEPVSEA
jgi:drug/metabolite transporter (DMT)-like permease